MTAPALVAVLSTLAAVVGIFGIVPQFVTMLRSRSSAGQSPVGWCLGVTCHAAMAFANLVGYHATVLAAGNLLSLTGCLTAVWLVVRFRARAARRASGSRRASRLASRWSFLRPRWPTCTPRSSWPFGTRSWSSTTGGSAGPRRCAARPLRRELRRS